MKFTAFFIKRPVFTAVLSLIIIVIGMMGFMRIPVSGFPQVNSPVVTVTTTYTGASASIIESQITTPIENDLVGISGLDTIHSISQEGQSRVIMQFDLGVDVNAALNDVRNALATVTNQIPTNAQAPVIQKRDPNSLQTLIVTLQDPNMNSLALTDYANRYVVPLLGQLIGVSNVELYNERDYAMKVLLDPSKMAAHGVTVSDLTQVLTQQNINVPSGQIKSPSRYYSVLSQGELSNAKQFSQLIVRQQNGSFVRFGDVAQIKVGAENTDSAMRMNGQTAVGIGVYSEATANPIAVADEVNHSLSQLEKNFPEGMKLKIAFNSTTYLKDSLHAVYHDITLAIILVMVVVFAFLGSVRSSYIPIVTIPICLIGTCALIYFLNYSINVFTLLAFVLAIGLVVDDAIIMLENIYRHIEAGMAPMQAAIKGSSEIGFAIIAMTLTLAAVYAPIGFAAGMTGIVFRQFAFTLALAVILSGFVALTLSPMMSARLLKLPPPNNAARFNYHHWLDARFAKLISGYRRLLRWVLRHRLSVVGVLMGLSLVGYACFKSLPSQLTPAEDMGSFIVTIMPPADASFNYINNYSKKIETMVQQIPGVKSITMTVDPDQGGFGFVNLQPWSKRDLSAQQIMRLIIQKSHQIPGAKVSTVNMSTLGGGGRYGDSIQMVVSTNQSYAELHNLAQKVITAMKPYHEIASVDEDLLMNSKQYVVNVKKDLAAAMNVNVADITTTLQTMLGGSVVTQFNWNERDYDVFLQIPTADLQNLSVINGLYVRNTSGQMIPLSNLVNISQEIAPQQLPHDDRLRADTLYFQLKPGVAMGSVVDQLQQTAKKVLPSDVQVNFRGTAQRLLESRSTMLGSFALALVFIYLVLAAQFESFIDPFIILLTVPFSIVGALITLRLTGSTLSIYTNIGFITLIGLIAKHGILITEFANQQRREGKALMDAIVEACALRLRPILMTTAAMVIGAIPLALAHGAGAISRQNIGWVIVGGLTFGTFFSLFVVPVAYTFLSSLSLRKKAVFTQEERAP